MASNETISAVVIALFIDAHQDSILIVLLVDGKIESNYGFLDGHLFANAGKSSGDKSNVRPPG